MGKAINIDDTTPIVEDITASVMRNPDALISIARLKTKDNYTYMHSIAVCALMVSLAKQLDLSKEQARDAALAGLLHDIGKMTIPSEILNNPNTLTAAEFEVIKKAGSWFSYGETKLGPGRDAVKALIKDNPELADELEEKIKAIIKENNA